MSVPAIPFVDGELLAEHERAHKSLADTQFAMPDDVARLFRDQQRRLMTESMANVQAVILRAADQRMVLPPRGYLSTSQTSRLASAANAFRHIDSRVALVATGGLDRVVDSATPLILHALLEAGSHGKETNPGMLRTTVTSWLPHANRFTHPPAEAVAELYDATLHMIMYADVPACVKAGWTTFTMLTIHPFVDGNGRTSRALYMAVVAPSLPLLVDWGVLEQWAVWRTHYVSALQAGQNTDTYDYTRNSARPFVVFAIESSIAGAKLCEQRLHHLAERVAATEAGGLPRELAFVHTAIAIRGIATLHEVGECGLGYETTDAIVAELIRRDRLRWVPRPYGRRTPLAPDEFGLVAV